MRPRTGIERSIGGVRRPPVPGLLAALLTVFVLHPAPASAQAPAPAPQPGLLPPPAPAPPAGPAPPPPPAPPPAVPGSSAEPRERTVARQLAALRDTGLITPAAHDRARDRYTAARQTRRRLTGRRRVELTAVLKTITTVARRGELSSTRVPLAFETLERNRQWWTTGPLLRYGARVGFRGSELVWQSYPGQGIQVQWLATFGKANALFTGRTFDARLRALLDEALGLGAARSGGIAFESWFVFNRGRPPWVSALSQGTGLQALSRAGIRLADSRYLEAARAALGIFRTAPPGGVRVATARGAHYLQYSFAPRLRIVNGFVQALNGLHDFGALANDAEGRALFAAGDAQLRAELPRADTGAWSRYSVGGKESDLGYHRLLRDFLRGLCERTTEALYCDTATRFTADLRRPPVLALVPAAAAARAGKAARVPFTLDKISSVSLVATRGRELVFARTARFARGRHAFALPKLRKAGDLMLRLRAVDAAGNASAVAERLAVRAGVDERGGGARPQP